MEGMAEEEEEEGRDTRQEGSIFVHLLRPMRLRAIIFQFSLHLFIRRCQRIGYPSSGYYVHAETGEIVNYRTVIVTR